jgi:hypothetical protein
VGSNARRGNNVAHIRFAAKQTSCSIASGVGLSMSSHSWLDIWKLFLDVLSHEAIAMQIAVGLGTAFFAVMALEGIRASFFPKRIAERVALRAAAVPVAVQEEAAAPQIEQPDIRAAAVQVENPAPVQTVYERPARLASGPAFTVNPGLSRRSSPQRLRVIGQQKPI